MMSNWGKFLKYTENLKVLSITFCVNGNSNQCNVIFKNVNVFKSQS